MHWCFVLTFALTSSAWAASAKSVYLLSPEAPDPTLAKTLVEAMAAELGKQQAYRVITDEDVKSVLQVDQTKQLMGCAADRECAAKIQEQTKADLLLATSVGRVGRSLILNLTLIDPRATDPVGRVGADAANMEELLSRIPQLLAELFGNGGSETATFALPDQSELSFGVFAIEAAGVEADLTKNLTQILSTELKRIRGAKVISPEDIIAILGNERVKQLLGADCDRECMSKISGALGVDYVIVGHLGQLSGTYVLSLRLIDQRNVDVVNRVTDSFRGPEDELVRAMRYLGRRLVGVSTQDPGTLAVSGPVSEAEVYLDNERIGLLPIKPEKQFPSGRVALRVTKDGFYDWSSDVFIQPGETTVVWAELQEQPEPWYAKWWVWTIVGVVVAGTATGIALGVRSSPSTGSALVAID